MTWFRSCCCVVSRLFLAPRESQSISLSNLKHLASNTYEWRLRRFLFFSFFFWKRLIRLWRLFRLLFDRMMSCVNGGELANNLKTVLAKAPKLKLKKTFSVSWKQRNFFGKNKNSVKNKRNNLNSSRYKEFLFPSASDEATILKHNQAASLSIAEPWNPVAPF